MSKSAYVRFVSSFEQRGSDECWPWTGSSLPHGYGRLMVEGRKMLAHRYMWELTHGEAVPEGMTVCHHCDNPPCVNPDHLFLGTPRDNWHDAAQKDRRVIPRGDGHYRTIVPDADLRAILARVAHGETRRAIAQEYGVHETTIGHIASGRRAALSTDGLVP